jgi:signal peptidase II
VKRLLWPGLIIVSVVLLDQLSKIWAVGALYNQPSIEIWGDFLRFTLVYNLGGAMGTSLGPSGYYLIVALVILPILGYYLWQYRNDYLYSLPLASIIGGAVGNVIDRIRIGKVVDFIDVDFFNIHIGGFELDRWWTFNIADAAISCALVTLVVVLLIRKPKTASETVTVKEAEPAK